jgi:hypothetical protein
LHCPNKIDPDASSGTGTNLMVEEYSNPLSFVSLGGVSLGTILSSPFLGLVASGVVAVILAITIQAIREENLEIRKKKQIALLLGYEIAQLKAIADASLVLDSAVIDDFKARVQAGHKEFVFLNGMAWSRAVYDRAAVDLSLLPSDLIPVISDIYRQMEVCDHLKKLANDVAVRGRAMALQMPGADSAPNYVREVNTMIEQFTSYSEMYFANLEPFTKTCERAIRGLSKIARINEDAISKPQVLSPSSIHEPLVPALTPSSA